MPTDDKPFPLSYPLGFLARAAALAALSCASGLLILWWVFSRDLGSEFGPAFYTLKNLLGFLLPALAFCALVVLLVASVAVFVVAVFASHKVAGPLFRLQRVAGYLERRLLIGTIHLRAGDQGKVVALAINDWVRVRKERLASVRLRVRAFENALTAYKDSLAKGDSAAISGLTERLRRSARELQHK